MNHAPVHILLVVTECGAEDEAFARVVVSEAVSSVTISWIVMARPGNCCCATTSC